MDVCPPLYTVTSLSDVVWFNSAFYNIVGILESSIPVNQKVIKCNPQRNVGREGADREEF